MRFSWVEPELASAGKEVCVLKFSIPAKKINFKQQRPEENC